MSTMTPVVTVEPPLPEVVVSVEPSLPEVYVEVAPPAPEVLVEVIEPGGTDSATVSAFDYLMPVAQTTATFSHTLGRDPVAVQVIIDGSVCDEYSVTFPLPGKTVQVGFDVSVRALIRLI